MIEQPTIEKSKMRCRNNEHTSIHRATVGQYSECLNCHLPLVHDGSNWRITYEIGSHKARKLHRIYRVDQILGELREEP